ncbi:DUF3489 domain-containing protein [Starkeya sp. 3C]|jgi:hypothetical protein|uniref:DUF3489 domain-containing protein n=1 Tax=Ancylobacter moscoviensis TaxID=2597768 RepID=A0ABY3DUM2_9HYPH|nr:DUF3489 domain-containing protein [Ancylobacter moscoviensis]TSJ64138.1 DUF3489 domain-containing protein [Ancylobacter moscoviensis]
MTKLTDTQLVIIAAACQRAGRVILPLPENLKGGAVAKVIDSLAAKGMIEEADAKPGEPVWRETGDRHRVTLIATDAALEALGITEDPPIETASEAGEREPAPVADFSDASYPLADEGMEASLTPKHRARDDSKQAKLIEMLRRPDGATIEEIVGAFGWQPHTVRGAIAGALKKKLGLDVTSEKIEKRGRVYRIAG